MNRIAMGGLTGAIAVLSLSLSSTASATTPPPAGEPAIRLQSVFTGDKEQPAVSYFIPWQGTTTPDKLQWNIENKHDNTLQPIDREVMQRSMHIYNDMKLEQP